MQTGPALIAGSPKDASGRHRRGTGSPRGETTNGARCDVHLTLPASAGNVVLVRRLIGTVAESLGMSLAQVEDVKLAVTEACTNVVRHAYAGRPGTMEVIARSDAAGLRVVVTDEGGGFQPRADTGGRGLGLPLMAAVTSEFRIDQDPERGTRVRMSFSESE